MCEKWMNYKDKFFRTPPQKKIKISIWKDVSASIYVRWCPVWTRLKTVLKELKHLHSNNHSIKMHCAWGELKKIKNNRGTWRMFENKDFEKMKCKCSVLKSSIQLNCAEQMWIWRSSISLIPRFFCEPQEGDCIAHFQGALSALS